jgi:hypothetical protein
MFDDLLELLKHSSSRDRALRTDSSILLVYPPEREHDFCEDLVDRFLPLLRSQDLPHQHVDLGGFLFEELDDGELDALEEDELDDYRWMKQGLSRRVEVLLTRRLQGLAHRAIAGTILVSTTVALWPLLRFGELLRGLRDVPCPMAFAFPGEEREGKLYFLGLPDGGNYLAIKLFWR